jgi:hypothetical protein
LTPPDPQRIEAAILMQVTDAQHHNLGATQADLEADR